MKKACIFDLDGTLTNTLPTIAYYANGALRANGLLPFEENEYRYFVGNGAKVLVRRMLAERGVTDEQTFLRVYRDYNAAYDAAPLYLTEIYPGVKELLVSLVSRGVRLAVLSNKPDYAAKEVVRHFFGEIFDVAHGAREGVPLKPAPNALWTLLEELGGISLNDALYVGDSSVDMETGKAAGVSTVGVSWGFRDREELLAHGADAIADRAEQIAALCASL